MEFSFGGWGKYGAANDDVNGDSVTLLVLMMVNARRQGVGDFFSCFSSFSLFCFLFLRFCGAFSLVFSCFFF